jgi:hypothetical protein
MTMSDKGPGAFYRKILEPTAENAVDDKDFRDTFLQHGAFSVCEPSERKTRIFGVHSIILLLLLLLLLFTDA